MANTLVRLTYRSRSRVAPDDKAALQAIFRTSVRNNKAHKVTGALALPDGHFVQVIEGPAETVAALMEKIRADTRHETVTVLGEVDIQARLFVSWTMARPDLTALSDQAFRIINEAGSGAQVTTILLGLLGRSDYWVERF